jgi:hypothetical protein
MISLTGFAAALIVLLSSGDVAGNPATVVIYDGKTTEIGSTKADDKDLWISTADLTRATGFELKPQGVCTDKFCFPLPADKKKEFVTDESSTTWFNLSAFARLLKQPVAHDAKHKIWFFGPRPEVQNNYLTSLIAPDFTLPDLNGKMHSLADFRGKKVLLLTWGSW